MNQKTAALACAAALVAQSAELQAATIVHPIIPSRSAHAAPSHAANNARATVAHVDEAKSALLSIVKLREEISSRVGELSDQSFDKQFMRSTNQIAKLLEKNEKAPSADVRDEAEALKESIHVWRKDLETFKNFAQVKGDLEARIQDAAEIDSQRAETVRQDLKRIENAHLHGRTTGLSHNVEELQSEILRAKIEAQWPGYAAGVGAVLGLGVVAYALAKRRK